MRSLLRGFLLLFFFVTPVWAVDPKTRISQYAHTAWRVRDGAFSGSPNAIAQTRDGYLWIGTQAGLVRFDDVQFTPWVPPDGKRLPSSQVLRWKPPGSSVEYGVPVHQSGNGLNGVEALVVRPDGAMWIGLTLPGRGGGLQQFTQGTWKAFVTPTFDSSALNVNSLWLDSRNSLWIGTEGTGVYRIHEGKADHFRNADGLSSDSIENFFEDREGNLWVATTEGLDRFRDLRVINFSTHEGLSGDKSVSVLASRDGTVWIGNRTGLDYIHGESVSTIGPKDGLPGLRVTSLFEDHAGRLWIGVENGLFIYEGGRFTPVRHREGVSISVITAMTEDVDGNIWAETTNPKRLLRIQDRKVREEYPESQIPYAYALTADPRGGIWLGFMKGNLGRYQMGKLEIFPIKQGPSTPVFDLVVDSDGSVLGATEEGLIEWRSGNLRTLTVSNGLPCNFINTIIFDRQSNLWLAAECSLIEIARDQLQKWREQPDAKINFKNFDVFDGAQPTLPPFRPAATRSIDGRLWFANEMVVQVIDPEHLAENPIPPPVCVEKVIADQKLYSPGEALRLPPLTPALEIHYTALSFVVPEKVRFRYKLEGHDPDWQDPGTRRQAFYNDLRPGNYTFRVIASNNDGVWNETGATLAFRVEPAWYQTYCFLVLCVGAGLFLAWFGYSLRVRQIAGAISVRFDERLAERTRIARELHDTLLQTVQGSKLVADVALEKSSDSVHVRLALEKLSKWLGQATQEGRAALNSLRSSTVETNDLAAGLQRVAEDCLFNRSMTVKFSVVGEARDMHPIVRDEIYRIGYEAIRNACEHSSASQLKVELNYAQDLTLRVIDDGIGIEPAVLLGGKEGHFGLQGMRERAERIAGKLTLVSSPNSGAEITLVVPGGMIFRKTNVTRFKRIKAAFRRMDGAFNQN